MKVAALATLGVLIVLPAEAAQQQRQYAVPATTCDNDGHCTTLSASTPSPGIRKVRPKAQKTLATEVQQLPQPRPVQAEFAIAVGPAATANATAAGRADVGAT